MEVSNVSQQKQFSVEARRRSFGYAFRGMGLILKTQHNFWIQLAMAAGVVAGGVFFQISMTEWALIVLSMTGVLVTESINTALEIDIDLTSPEYHPYARDTKDVAAGAVLISVIGAVIIGIIIFLPKVVTLLS